MKTTDVSQYLPADDLGVKAGWSALAGANRKEGSLALVLEHYPMLARCQPAAHYAERLIRRGRDATTLYNYARSVNRFLTWCSENQTSFESIEAWQVEEYFDEAPYSPLTKRTHLSNIRALYRYSLRRGLITKDPTYDVELPLPKPKKPRILSNQDLREIKARCQDGRQWLLFHSFAYTGCRRDEIRTLHWSSVDFPRNTVYIIGKGHKERFVPIHPALGEALSEAYPGRPQPDNAVIPGPYGKELSTTGLAKLLHKVAPGVTFHDFRRTVASNLDANGVQEGVIERIMGWAPQSVFDRHYRHVADERLQQAILRLYSEDPV